MTITFDPTTAGTAVVLVFVLESLTMGFLWYGVRKYAGVTAYIIGALLQAVGYTVLISHHFMADITQTFFLILNFIATVLVMLGYTGTAYGVARFLGVAFPRSMIALAATYYSLFLIIYAFSSFSIDSEKMRVMLSSLYVCSMASAVIWWTFRRAPYDLRLTGWTMGYIHIFFSFYTLLRALNSIFGWQIPWVDMQDVSVQLYTYVGVASFIMYLSFLLLVGQRLLNSSRKAKKFNESILANLPLGIQVMDGEQRPLRRNQALRTLLASMDIASQQRLEKLINQETERYLQHALPRYVVHNEYDISVEDGTTFTMQSRTFDIQERWAETTHIVTVLEDISEKKRYQRKLEQLVSQDALTGVLNRRSFEERLRHEWQRALRRNFPLSLAVIDLDKFKLINDTYGHNIGDRVLCQAAEIMQQMGRKEDIFARYGGEEFVLLLPHCDVEEARQLCERLRQSVQNYPWQRLGLDFPQTVSIGIAEAVHCVDTSQLFQEADKALYQAKTRGRNQVVLADTTTQGIPQFTQLPSSY